MEIKPDSSMALGSIKEDFPEEVANWALKGQQGSDSGKSQLGVGRGWGAGLRGRRHTWWGSSIRGTSVHGSMVRGCVR